MYICLVQKDPAPFSYLPVNTMTKYLSTLAFALFLFSTHLEADTITVTDTIDFEGSNDAMNIASFSQLDRVTFEFD